MATSRSLKTDQNYIAGVSIFSGRPDPTWPLDQNVATQLVNLWDDLDNYTGSAPSPPPLGYRGVFVRNEVAEEWRAYRGVVAFSGPNEAQLRSDPDRSFERTVIASAPEGLIPPAVLSGEFK